MRPLAAALCLPLAFAGCATLAPPPPAPTFAVPATWTTDAPGALPARTLEADWWLRFQDPPLARLVALALEANTSVRGAQASLRQARALSDASVAALYPSVGASANAQRSTAGRDSESNSFRAGLDASWELDLFGANRNARDASQASALASEASLAGARVSVAAEVALAYIALRGGQARLAIATENLAIQDETLQITRWREQAGLVTALETAQARASAEQVRAQVPAIETAIAQSRHALAVLTGQPPATLASELAAAAPVPSPGATLALAIPAETLRQRPDVRAAEQQVLAAASRVAQADAARYPRFSLGGSIGLNALALGALTDGASVVSSLLAGVSMPVFDAGALGAQVRAQQAAMDAAQAGYEATVLAALKEVEDALVALRGDREREKRLAVAAEAAGTAALLARQRYASGLVDFQVVLDTQRSQLATQEALANAGADVSADHVRLFKALGGGWRPGEDDPDSKLARTPRP